MAVPRNQTQEPVLQPNGLWTFPNVFSDAPPGALEEATNVVIDRPGVVSSRRGFTQYTVLAAAVTNALTATSYQSTLIFHANSTGGGADVLVRDNGDGSCTQYSGTYDVPDLTDPTSRVRFVQTNKNCYLTTSTGVVKLDAATGTPSSAGAPRALSGSGVTTGASGFMTNSVNVAYRVVWAITDANGNLVRGVPSERIIVSNVAGGTRNVSLTFQVPSSVTTAWTYKIYRSLMTVDATIVPDDELQLCLEASPTGGQVAALSATVTDSLAESLLGETIYTAVSQQGFENANYQPPFAQDACLYKQHVVLANTRRKHALTFSLTATGTPGLVANDTVTFTIVGGATFTLTAKAASDPAFGEFKVVSGGVPASDVEATARELVTILNEYVANTFLRAYYVSGFEDVAGQIMIERTDLTDVAVAVTSSNGTAFTPNLPSGGSTLVTSAETSPHRLWISKLQEPEAFPLYRTIDVGSASEPILRVAPLRDGVIVIKSTGVWRLAGDVFENFTLTVLNSTINCNAPNSVVVLDNRVVMMTTQGVIALSESGVLNLSRPIERTLLELSSANFPGFAQATHGTAYESDHKYVLWTVTQTTDTRATRGFVFNLITQSWTEWDRAATVGFVNPTDDKLYLGYYSVSDGAVFQERKLYARTDFADDQYAVTVTAHTTTSTTISATAAVTSALAVGMTLVQNAVEGIIQSITPLTSTTCTLHFSVALVWFNAVAAVNRPIAVHVKTIPVTGRDPLSMKRFTELNLIFSDASFTGLTVTFTSDLSTTATPVTLTSVLASGNERLRTYVPMEQQRANYLQLQLDLEEAFTSFALNGFQVLELRTATRMR